MWVRGLAQHYKRLAAVDPGRACSSMPDVREFVGRGLSAITEVERLLPHTDFNDHRLQPLLKAAKQNFELALEVQKENTDVMLWLARLHLYYNIPGANLTSGAALLETAADLGNADAQYELACRIRSEGALLGDADFLDERVINYLESAACQVDSLILQKHAGALFLAGAIYLSGKHMARDPKAAAWCFRKAAEQGHIPAATVYASLLTKGANWEEVRSNADDKATNFVETTSEPPVELDTAARAYFEKAAEGGDSLALEWLTRLPPAPPDPLLSS